MSLRQKSRTVLHSQLQKTVSGLCLLRLPEVMLSRGPALLKEDKAFRETNGPAQRVELCAGRAAPPPPTICERRRRRLLLIGAPPPPPIICRRAADTIFAA